MLLWGILSSIIGYLLGSINSSLIVGKFYGVDVRQHGSGNAGATNTLRTLGKSAAILVLVGDIAKGVVSYLIGLYIAGDTGALVGGAACILGHNWPLYFKFKGGKGALTSMAVVFMMDWKIALMILASFVLVVAITRYVSLGSILAAGLFPVVSLILQKNITFIVFALFIAVLIIVRHRSNIKRLINGTESKFGKK